MPTQFSASINEYAAFNAYPAGAPPTPAHPIPVTGVNVNGWTLDSEKQSFNYKIIHNLNLSDPGKLIVQITSVSSSSCQDPIHARVFPGFPNYFVVQGYGLRPGLPRPIAEYEHSCAFSFVAELFS